MTKSVGINKPVVVSTWNFGVAANEEAWKVLSAGGRALDAVEAGVRVSRGRPQDPIAIQFVGALAATLLFKWLVPSLPGHKPVAGTDADSESASDAAYMMRPI